MSILSRWLQHLSPSQGEAVADAISELTLNPSYHAPPGSVSAEDLQLLGIDWSFRVDGPDRCDAARLSLCINRTEARRGAYGRVMRAVLDLDDCPLIPIADHLHRHKPDVDLFMGIDLGGPRSRAKLYIGRPAGRDVTGFDTFIAHQCDAIGVNPNLVTELIHMAGHDPGVFGIDALTDGSLHTKLYFNSDSDDLPTTLALLEQLDEPLLLETLHRAAPWVLPNSRDAFTLAIRVDGDQILDTNLHIRMPIDMPLDHIEDPWLRDTWLRIQTEAAALVGRTLFPSYQSWLVKNDKLVLTLYYLMTPIPRPNPSLRAS